MFLSQRKRTSIQYHFNNCYHFCWAIISSYIYLFEVYTRACVILSYICFGVDLLWSGSRWSRRQDKARDDFYGSQYTSITRSDFAFRNHFYLEWNEKWATLFDLSNYLKTTVTIVNLLINNNTYFWLSDWWLTNKFYNFREFGTTKYVTTRSFDWLTLVTRIFRRNFAFDVRGIVTTTLLYIYNNIKGNILRKQFSLIKLTPNYLSRIKEEKKEEYMPWKEVDTRKTVYIHMLPKG